MPCSTKLVRRRRGVSLAVNGGSGNGLACGLAGAHHGGVGGGCKQARPQIGGFSGLGKSWCGGGDGSTDGSLAVLALAFASAAPATPPAKHPASISTQAGQRDTWAGNKGDKLVGGRMQVDQLARSGPVQQVVQRGKKLTRQRADSPSAAGCSSWHPIRRATPWVGLQVLLGESQHSSSCTRASRIQRVAGNLGSNGLRLRQVNRLRATQAKLTWACKPGAGRNSQQVFHRDGAGLATQQATV